jgi:putative transposase
MPQSLAAIFLHLVFSTKNRQPFLRNTNIREEAHRLIGGASKTLDCPPLIVGGVEDHVHVLCRFGRTITLADWVKELKRVSNQQIKQFGPGISEFQWQGGYAAFSVSQSNVDAVKRYIANQDEHHRKVNFQDELRTLLREYQQEWDERYAWD